MCLLGVPVLSLSVLESNFYIVMAASCDGRLPTLVAIRYISLHIIVLQCELLGQ